MVLKLDPRLPILWRTPTSVQVGTDGVAVLHEVSDGDARLLAALAAGVSQSGYAMLARTAGVGVERADDILAALSSSFEAPRAAPASVAAVMGDSPLARDVAALLSASGSLGRPEEASVIVLVAGWVLAPADHMRWLNRDVAHVPVLAAEESIEVGPFVEPGVGPCLYCVHLARTDDDATWPAVATQLLARPEPALGPLHRAEATAFVARRVVERLSGTIAGDTAVGTSWRLDAEGRVSVREWARHPGCRCAVPPGTDWADAPARDLRVAPTTARAVAALA